MFLALLALQAATPPDIELHATVRARSMTIGKRGDARLTVTTDPQGKSIIEAEAPGADGRKAVRNPTVRLNVEARIADPLDQIAAGVPEAPQ